MPTQPTKTCITCHIPKPLKDFRRQGDTKDGRRSTCTACVKAADDKRKAEKKEYGKKYFTF
jgi:hypothetical protein